MPAVRAVEEVKKVALSDEVRIDRLMGQLSDAEDGYLKLLIKRKKGKEVDDLDVAEASMKIVGYAQRLFRLTKEQKYNVQAAQFRAAANKALA